MGKRLYVLYDKRACLGDTSEATVFETFSSKKEALSSGTNHGTPAALYSYIKMANGNLTDERLELIFS